MLASSKVQALSQQAQEAERLKKELASQEVQMNAVRYRAEQAEQQIARQDAARLREAAQNLTCAVCKMDMHRALKGA